MLVSHIKRFIYTKTAKTAGTSVESYFEQYCMPAGTWKYSHGREEYVSETGIIGERSAKSKKLWYNHMAADKIRQQLGEALWNEYFKFCIIRNPFDKLVSLFHAKESRLNKVEGIYKQKVEKSLKGCTGETVFERFKDWIAKGVFIDRNKYMTGSDICVDYFIRFENLEDGIRHVCKVLEVPFEPKRIPRLKSKSRPVGFTLGDYYDAKTIDIVSEKYAFEIDYFGYEPPSDIL